MNINGIRHPQAKSIAKKMKNVLLLSFICVTMLSGLLYGLVYFRYFVFHYVPYVTFHFSMPHSAK